MKFKLGDFVGIVASSESGEIIGYAVYLNQNEPQYLLRYKNALGVAVEAWWAESALG